MTLLSIFSLFLFKINTISNDFSNDSNVKNTIHHIQNSIEAYAFTHSRLPCPSEDDKGIALSNCSTIREGYVPYQTLGIYDIAAKSIGYKLPPPAEDNYTDLTKDKVNSLKIAFFQEGHANINLYASDYMNAKPYISSTDHFIDFCVALGNMSNGIEKSNGIAYTLYEKNIFNPILTNNIHEKLKSNLFDNLNCSRLISASARTHINIASAIESIRRSAQDGLILNKITHDKADLSVIFSHLALIWNSIALTNASLDLTRTILNATSISISANMIKASQVARVSVSTALLAWRAGWEKFYKWNLGQNAKELDSINTYDASYNDFMSELKDLNVVVSDNAFRSIYEGLGLSMSEKK